LSWAALDGESSALKPLVRPPAKVVMVPSGPMRRTMLAPWLSKTEA
jgi:hypothetical protein